MRRFRRFHRLRRSGTTLVEMIVTLLLFGIMMTMVIGVISPASKIFIRMQRLQFAQIIVDNTIQELRGIVGDAAGHVKIYAACDNSETGIVGALGAEKGLALEFVNEENYVVLLSSEGCPDTDVYLGGTKLGATIPKGDVEPGRLLVRYYVRTGAGEDDYSYDYKSGTQATVRAFSKVFSDGYYMGNYVEVTFSYPSGTSDEGKVEYLNAEVKLYRDKDKTELLAQDSVTLDLRYDAKRHDKATAKAKPADSTE